MSGVVVYVLPVVSCWYGRRAAIHCQPCGVRRAKTSWWVVVSRRKSATEVDLLKS